MSLYADIFIDASTDAGRQKLQTLLETHSMRSFLLSKSELAATVRQIVADVGQRGDAAVADYTEKFDKIRLQPADFRVPQQQLKDAHSQMDRDLLASIRKAAQNIRDYQSSIFIARLSQTVCGIRYTPLHRVGLCIPGASAPLPSTVLMTAIPAQAAGVQQIAVVSPPRWNGSIHPVILGVCWELGITEVYRVGGAQAVAALAWGTDSIPKVDKIVGPGNDVVQLAKKEVFGLVDMDSFAGPSDVLIVANDCANPAWVAADMLSQAEHDPGAGILACDSKQLAASVLDELERQTASLSRAQAAQRCLKSYSAVIVFETIDKVIDFANTFAAEHLQIQCGSQSRAVAERIVNGGAIFIGPHSPVAVGDYFAGPSHTLPTRQSSRYFSALSSNDFVKASSLIEYSAKQLADAAQDICRLALAEGLDAHAKSVQIRIK